MPLYIQSTSLCEQHLDLVINTAKNSLSTENTYTSQSFTNACQGDDGNKQESECEVIKAAELGKHDEGQ